jgi:NADPH:quinone reductase-like Zn-dependent oxidoreductase
MKAIVFHEHGGPEVLRLEDVPDPEPGPGEVLVDVRAASVGRTLDIAARAGRLPFAKIALPHVLGADHAGVVVGLGEGAEGFGIGDRVAAFPAIWCAPGECRFGCAGREDSCRKLQILGVHRRGAYAERVVVPDRNLTGIPADVSDVDAAAIASLGPVAAAQVTAAGGIGPGQWMLVIAGGSALGSMTAVYGKHLGAGVIVTSRNAGKLPHLVQRLGVDHAFTTEEPDFVERVLEITDGRGVDVVVDNVGAAGPFQRALASLAVRGVIVSSGGFVDDPLEISIRSIYTRTQQIVGVRTGNVPSIRRAWHEVGRGFRGPVDRVFELAEAADAHRYVELDQNIGRVVLTLS